MHGDNVAPKANVAMSEYGSTKRIKRSKVFMLSPKGKLMGWNPDLSSTAGVLGVWALANGKGSVYVGGDFTGVHGKQQQRFAILKGLRRLRNGDARGGHRGYGLLVSTSTSRPKARGILFAVLAAGLIGIGYAAVRGGVWMIAWRRPHRGVDGRPGAAGLRRADRGGG